MQGGLGAPLEVGPHLLSGGNSGKRRVNNHSVLRRPSLQKLLLLIQYIFPSFIKAPGSLLGPATDNRHLHLPEHSLLGVRGPPPFQVASPCLHSGLSCRLQPRGWAPCGPTAPRNCGSQGFAARADLPCLCSLNLRPAPPLPGEERDITIPSVPFEEQGQWWASASFCTWIEPGPSPVTCLQCLGTQDSDGWEL